MGWPPSLLTAHGIPAYLQQGARTYGNLGAAFVESNTSDRVALDLRGFTRIQVFTFVSVPGNTGVLRLEYATTVGPLNWATLSDDVPLGGAAGGHGSVGVAIPHAAQITGGVLVRMVAGLGDGAEDPQVQGTSFELFPV